MLLENDDFLLQLTNLAQKVKNDSSFTVTFKRYDGHDRPTPRPGKPPLPEPTQNYCLIRMKAKSKKISTVVKKDEVPRIMEAYGKILRQNCDGLKKIKRVKNKSKAAQG